MLFLLIGGSIFLFLSLSIGYVINKALRGSLNYSTPLFEILLTGTATITVYLNLLSFFFPVDYLVPIPIFLASIFIWYTTSFCVEVKGKMREVSDVLFSKSNRLVTISISSVILLFALVPPYNTDSSGYHYLSILWNEKYKIVPGLANLFPQFGYNSAFMVLSAPFSFTDLAKQSIYPINIVLVLAFFLWILHKSYSYNDWRKYIIWLLLFIFLRQFPINIASPSADALASILIFYIFLSINKVDEEWNLRKWIIPFCFILFSITIKISTAPLFLFFLLPLLFYQTALNKIRWSYFKVLLIAVVIIVPWLLRNIILSGYLVFPLSSTGIFNVDWKVPFDIALAEQQHISHAPRMISQNFAYVDTLPFYQWFPEWMNNVWNGNLFNSVLVTLGLLSPLVAWSAFKGKGSITRLYKAKYLIAYTGVIFWMMGSPDVRFGYSFLVLCIFLPLMFFAEKKSFYFKPKQIHLAFTTIVFIYCVYYAGTAVTMLKSHNIADFVVKPLRDPVYFRENDLATFKFVMLNDSVKLYIHDPAHHSINAPLPSCAPYRAGIRMRGNTLQEGFKTIQ